MQLNQAHDKMASQPVDKLMIGMGLPMILSMALQAVYNIVDSAFVANMSQNGEEALNALTLAFPIQMLMIAIAIGTGVGTNVLLSKTLGQGNLNKAKQIVANAIMLALLISLCFFCFGFVGVKGYIGTQTSNPLISAMAVDYLSICCVASLGIIYFAIFEKVLQATGHAKFSTLAQVSGALTNIVLDPILIYGLFGIPTLSVKGAAIATVIGQVVSFLVALGCHLKLNPFLRFKSTELIPNRTIIFEIYEIGLPAIIAQALMSFMTYAINIVFVSIGENVVTAYGLFYKLQQFMLFIAFGLRDALTPIIAFNHGMRHKTRVEEGIKYGMGYTLILMLVGTLILEIFAVPMAAWFNLSQETTLYLISAIRIIALSFVFAGANIAYQGIFQALGSGFDSLAISLSRQLIIVLPLAFLCAHFVIIGSAPTALIWFTFPMTELITAVVAWFLMRGLSQRKLSSLGEAIG